MRREGKGKDKNRDLKVQKNRLPKDMMTFGGRRHLRVW